MIHFDIETLKNELKELEKQTGNQDFWLDTNNSNKVLSKIKSIKGKCQKYDEIKIDIQNELELIADLLCGNTKYNKEEALNNPALDKHVPWIEELIEQNRNVSLEEARRIVKDSVGQIFSRVLEDAGVFKRTEKGQKGLEKFITESIY